MATAAAPSSVLPVTAVGAIDRLLALGAAIMAAVLVAALVGGADRLAEIPPLVGLHLLTIGIALAVTPFLLLRRRGDRRHRQLGYVWVASLAVTSLASLFIRDINDGGFSPIHILSVATLVGLFGIVANARAHKHEKHRRIVRMISAGALLLAGFFTLAPSRLLGSFLFG